MSHPLELPTGQQKKGRGASTPLGYWLRLANFLLGDCGVSVCACVCVSEQRKKKTKCFLPEAGLGLLYPTGLSFLLPFSAASALRETERGGNLEGSPSGSITCYMYIEWETVICGNISSWFCLVKRKHSRQAFSCILTKENLWECGNNISTCISFKVGFNLIKLKFIFVYQMSKNP